MSIQLSSNEKRKRKHKGISQKIKMASKRHRLIVFRSNMHIYAQIMDDSKGYILAEASTLSSEIKENIKNGSNIAAASEVGALIAKRAIAAGITEVVFDRSGYIYHGRIKALAEAAREQGLKF